MSWENVSDNLKKALAEKRFIVGLERQSDLSSDFKRLLKLFDENDLEPFNRFGSDFFGALNNCSMLFRQGGHWKTADQEPNRYFYRIETLESFMVKHTRFANNVDFDNADYINLSIYKESKSLFGEIVLNYEKTSTWQSLRKLTTSFYCHRGFSWWSNDFDFSEKGRLPTIFYGDDLNEENQWLLEFAFKVGVSSDWLSDHMLFLRLDSEKIDKDNIKIPSVIDALCQPIFSPRAYQDDYRWGLAFDLNNHIKPIYKEFVLKNVLVDMIEYVPVRLDITTLDSINNKARLTNELVQQMINNI